MKRMTKKEYNEWLKQYYKFKNNNLPTPYWNEGNNFEYVYVNRFNAGHGNDDFYSILEVNHPLVYALGDICGSGLYYPYTTRTFYREIENGQEIIKTKIVRSSDGAHAHSFDEVLEELYDFPETFKIEKEDAEFYSEQELRYIRMTQNYLLFIGLKDLDRIKPPVSRYRNKLRKKYEKAYTRTFSNSMIDDAISGKKLYYVKEAYSTDKYIQTYKHGEYTALVFDKEQKIRMYIEYTKIECMPYKEAKINYPGEEFNDDEMVNIWHFKVLEVFD